MNLKELHQAAAERIRSQPGSVRPTITLRVPGEPNRRTKSYRRRLCPGGPIGEIASSQPEFDNVWFSAAEVMAWCERQMARSG